MIFRIFWCIIKQFPLRLILCDIPLWKIPTSTTFGHPYGITIADNTSIGENCSIVSNVTIGCKHLNDKGAIIGNNVFIGAGSIILGAIKIGNNVIISAGSIVLYDIPDNTTYINPIGKR